MTKITEEELTQSAQDKGAARVTLEGIEANIISEHYFSAHDGAVAAAAGMGVAAGEARIPRGLRLVTYCVLTLRNGFTITGQSACADPKNYSQVIGQGVARQDAIRQIWPLMGYELRTYLNNLDKISDDELGEALTRMTAFTLGNPEAFRPKDANLILRHFTNTDHGEEGGRTFATDGEQQ